MKYEILEMFNQNSIKFEFVCLVNAQIFHHIFAYYDSPLSIGSDEIINRLQMWLNGPQCGHKEGQKFSFFGEIAIKESLPIHLIATSPGNSSAGAVLQTP